MQDKLIVYRVNGDTYDVPESRRSAFEAKYPNATIEMHVGDDIFDVPFARQDAFLSKYPDASYLFDSIPEDDSSARREERRARRQQRWQDRMERFGNWAISANDSLSRAELGSAKTESEAIMETATAPPPSVDEEMADMVIDSFSENRARIEDFIEGVDSRYAASAEPEQKKSFWQQLGDEMRMAHLEQRMGPSARIVEGQLDERVKDMEKGQDYVDAKTAKRISDRVRDKVEQYLDPAETFVGGVGQGIADTAFDLENWDATVGLEEAMRVYSIKDKLESGEPLTEGEEMIVDALVDDLASDMYLAAGFGRGYKAGVVTGESLPFMLETAMNPASKFGEAITKKFGASIFRRVSSKLGKMVGKAAVYGTRAAADLTGAAIMSSTTSAGRVAEDAFNRLNGQVDFVIDDDGTLSFNGFVGGEDSMFKAYAKAYGANTIEHFSEMVGNYFEPIAGMAKSGLVKMADKVGAKRIKSLLTEMTPNGFGALLNDFTEQTQWNGVFGEFAEEMVSGAMNALVVGDQTLRKYDENGELNDNYLFEKNNLIDTFLGVSILGGAITAAKTVGYSTPETRYNREISRAKKSLGEFLNEDEIEILETFANNPFGTDFANLEYFFSDAKSEESRKAVADYLKAVMEKEGYNIAHSADLSGTQQGMAELQNAYQLGQNMSEADLYDLNQEESKAISAIYNFGLVGEDGPLSEDDLNNMDSYSLLSLSNDMAEDYRDAVRKLAIVRNAKEGLKHKLYDIANGIKNGPISIANTTASNGMLTVATYQGGRVYVKGDVTIKDGLIEVPENSGSHPVIIVDSVTGEVKVVGSEELTQLEKKTVEEQTNLISSSIDMMFNDRINTWGATQSTRSKLADIQALVGQKVFIDTGNGGMAEVEVRRILPNGEVLIHGKKGDLGGQSDITVDVDSFYDSMSRDSEGNLIFDQSQFRSQSKDTYDRLRNRGTEVPTSAPSPTPTAPSAPSATAPSPSGDARVDFRGTTVPIMINGTVTNVEVVSQDDASNIIVFQYTDENGNIRTGKLSYDEFSDSSKQAEAIAQQPSPVPVSDEFPEVPDDIPVNPEVVPTTPPAPTAPDASADVDTGKEAPAAPIEPETIDWDALFDSDPEAYFAELQNQFGEEALDILNEEIEAAQNELDALAKAKTKNQNERLENRNKKKALQKRIDTLNGMIERLTTVPAPETAPEPEPEVETHPTDPDEEDGTGLIDPKAKETVLDNGYIIKDGYVINPTPIEMPNSPKDFSRIFIAEKDGKWGYETYVKFDNMTSYGSPKGAIQVSASHQWFDTKEEAIKAALHYFEFLKNEHGEYKGKPHGTTGMDAFMQYVQDTYLKEPSAPEPVVPVAPTPVEDPIKEAQKREKSLATQLKRIGIPHEQKQDMAFNAGKAVADFFATREEYEAYAENATDFGEYNADFERGVDASFANRQQNTGVTPGNSVPLGNEPKGGENGGKEDAPEGGDTNGPAAGTDGGGTDNGGNKEGDSGDKGKVPSQGPSGSEGGQESGKVKHQYPARKGNVTGKTLIDTFGLAAVEIPDSRKQFLNTFYDFMMEMAKTLGISHKSIGNGGWLTLGNLRANATPFARHSITYGTFTGDVLEQHLLLKYSRVSSIAHEWWHSLDHALGFFESGKSKGPTTGMAPSAFDGRQETFDAVSAVMKAIQDSGYTARIKSLNYTQRFKNYVLEPTESAARAFAEYIRNKFDEQGIAITGVNEFYDETQPTAEEMKLITPAIENLFNVLQEKEGEKPGTSILYQIGEDVDKKVATSSETSEVARRLANEAIDMMFEQAGREVVFVTDEQAEQMRKLAGADAEFMIDSDKPVFVSNAAVAVMGIKQEKATPAQWLAMIEKAGGLKAGEDKWMGLSDWLKASDKKTLTKQEVLDYIVDNTIRIDEQHYDLYAEEKAAEVHAEIERILQEKFYDYVRERREQVEDESFDGEEQEYAIEKLREEMGDTFPYTIELSGLSSVYVTFPYEEIDDVKKWADRLGIEFDPDLKPINETRAAYTTDGLTNKREIALTVPTIESWGEQDEIHFGDAGDGRAVAWVRFGETYINEEADAAYEQARREEEEFKSQMEQKYGSLANGMRSTLTDEEYAHYMNLVNRTLQLNESRKTAKEKKVLVIDEIQSKRHQEGREQGYKVSREKADAEMDKFMKQMHDKYDFSSSTPFAEVFNEEEMREFARLSMQQHRATFGTTSVPDAPFEKNWHELAMKRMLRYAAENGYDAVAWTKGEQQSERYGIAKVVKDIYVAPSDVERYVSIKTISGDAIEVPTEPNSDVIVSGDYKGQRLSDVVGKELADKILSVPEGTDDYIAGEDLKVGGEGMKGFYDKMLPAFMNKYGKKWGIKVADITLPNVEEAGRVMHSVPVTDAMKESVMEGQVMFMKRPNGKVFGWTDGKKIYLTKDGLNPNTKIHEYTHLWAQAMMQKNPKGWQSVKDLLRGTPVWNEVLNDPNYSNIHADEDLVASEVLSRISGRDGSAKLESMAQQMVDEAKGTARKLEARGLVQRIKDALNEFWNWVGTELFGIEKFESVEQVTDRVLWDLMNATDLGSLEEGQTEFSIIPEGELKEKLKKEIEDGEYITLYRAVRKINGKYYSPKMSKLGGVGQEIVMGELEQSDERPDLAYPVTMADGTVKYKVNLDGSDPAGTGLKSRTTNKVDYNPYIHASDSMMNDQFTAAFAMPEMTVIEVRVPKSELTSGYHAEKAADHVGLTPWKSGTVDLKLPKDEQRNVYLSRYDMPVREVPTEEIADHIAAKLLRNGLSMPYNLVTPQVAEALIRRGVDVSEKPSGNVPAGQNEKFKELKERVLNDMKDNDSPITPEMDAEYLAAVERGDMETAQRMVNEAAKLAMPNTKVVDENGNPKVVYHGSPWHGFTKFESSLGDGGPIYFADDLAFAEQFADKHHGEEDYYENLTPGVYKAFINAENPIDLGDLGTWSDEARKHIADALNMDNLPWSGNGFEMLDFEKGFNSAIRERGYDSVYGYEHNGSAEGTQWAVYNPSQIKSAEPVTYDDNGNVIPLSERFNPEKNDIRYRKAEAQNAAVDYLAGEPRLRAIENAVNEEAAKLGVKVTYKTREQMPNGHQNDKGYYDPKTGEVVVCTENAISIADAIQTILHEAVAHKGLRQLMGDKFNEFINRVYESLDAETKAKVDALAESQYNGNKAVAMEEYMATLAESTDFNKDTLWDKIKSVFEDIINAILGRNDIKIGDNELRYILRASYNNMVNPRGMETMRGWAQDKMKREEYGVGKVSEDNAEFDNEDEGGILYRTGVNADEVLATSAKAVYDRLVGTQWQEIQREFQDAYQPVRIAIDAIQQETGNISVEDFENYLLVQNHSSSRSRAEIDEFERKYYAPIIDQVKSMIDTIMKARDWKLKDKKKRAEVYKEIRQYLIAKHGLERNKYYQGKTGEMRDYSGLTSLFGLDPSDYQTAESMAEDVIKTFETVFFGRVDSYDSAGNLVVTQGAEIDKLWKTIKAATDQTLRHSYESGIISRQQFDDIRSMFEFYIPLRGFEEQTAEDVYEYARFDGNRFSPAVIAAKGRTSVANDPLAYILNMAESEIMQGNKNKAKQALYHFVFNRTVALGKEGSLMQVESVWYYKNVDAAGNVTYIMAAPDRAAGETYDQFETRMKNLEASGDAVRKKSKVDLGVRFQKPADMDAHYVFLKINGEEKAVYINGNPKAAYAVNGKFHKEKSEFVENYGKVNRFLSSVFTNYSIEFTFRNLIRDAIYSRINISQKESPAYRLKFRKNWWKHNFISMAFLASRYRNGKLEKANLSETEKAFIEFMRNGGETGYVIMNKVENQKAALEREMKRLRNGMKNGGVKNSSALNLLFGWVELINQASELATRFAAFKTSRDMGRSTLLSVRDAKEITVNFNTKGAQDFKGWAGVIASYFGWSKYFFNASVQGVQNVKAMADANKLKFCGTVGSIIAAGFFMPVITSIISQLLGDDDDEEYWNIPEYDRHNNLCIVIGDKRYIKIPLPVGFREMFAIGDMVSAMHFDKKFSRDIATVGKDIANKIASIVLPINPLEGTANGLSLWQTFLYTTLPSSFQLFIQNATNTDWRGAPLQKEYTYNEGDPQWMKAFNSNPDWMKGLSKWCNENIDINNDFKGVDWSPEKLDNTLSNLLGGVYALIKDTGNTIAMIWNEDKRNISNVPVVGTLVGSGLDSDERFVSDAYYDMLDYYKDRVKNIEGIAKKFGYDLDDVFKSKKGAHHPKMSEVYSNDNFTFMSEWYKRDEKLKDKYDKVKEQRNKIASKNNPTQLDYNKLERLTNEYLSTQREMVNFMLELD